MTTIIVIRGPIGSGKSTTVNALKPLLPNVSLVDFDSFKRQIDYLESSSWRRELALDVAGYLCDRLMQHDRTIIADIHSSSREQFKVFEDLASKHNYKLISVLLYPPLSVCMHRSKDFRDRYPDAAYDLPEEMVKKYYDGTYFIDGEMKFDTSVLAADAIAHSILKQIPKF